VKIRNILLFIKCSEREQSLAALLAPVTSCGLLLFVAFSLCLTASAVNADGQSAQPRLPTIELGIGDKTLVVEVAATGQQRYMGLSFRESLGNEEGMLFVFENERPLTFTMRNTRIPLSIAYISKDLVINEIVEMDVGPNQIFPSQQPAQFALEVNQGWFKVNGIEAGDRIVRHP
jgi:uncharacterized membrane protein (UPF0127 family)